MPKCAIVRDANWFLSFVKTCFCRSTWPPAVTHSFQSPFFVMSFRQQLARNSVNVHQAWLADIKDRFMRECEKASRSGHYVCSDYPYPELEGCDMESYKELIRQQLQGILIELGFPEGKVQNLDHRFFRMYVHWSSEDADSKVSPPQTVGGTCTTCPICHEHRPAVALVPCGHVICRDCHRCQQLRQCPMCRATITSATNGLYLGADKCLEPVSQIFSKI